MKILLLAFLISCSTLEEPPDAETFIDGCMSVITEIKGIKDSEHQYEFHRDYCEIRYMEHLRDRIKEHSN